MSGSEGHIIGGRTVSTPSLLGRRGSHLRRVKGLLGGCQRASLHTSQSPGVDSVYALELIHSPSSVVVNLPLLVLLLSLVEVHVPSVDLNPPVYWFSFDLLRCLFPLLITELPSLLFRVGFTSTTGLCLKVIFCFTLRGILYLVQVVL